MAKEMTEQDKKVLALVLDKRKVAARETKVNQFKLAVCSYILDEAGVKDPKVRLAVWTKFRATDGGFGTNLSGYEQNNGLRVAGDEIEAYTGPV